MIRTWEIKFLHFVSFRVTPTTDVTNEFDRKLFIAYHITCGIICYHIQVL